VLSIGAVTLIGVVAVFVVPCMPPMNCLTVGTNPSTRIAVAEQGQTDIHSFGGPPIAQITDVTIPIRCQPLRRIGSIQWAVSGRTVLGEPDGQRLTYGARKLHPERLAVPRQHKSPDEARAEPINKAVGCAHLLHGQLERCQIRDGEAR
jgi:hypothetical protein